MNNKFILIKELSGMIRLRSYISFEILNLNTKVPHNVCLKKLRGIEIRLVLFVFFLSHALNFNNIT